MTEKHSILGGKVQVYQRPESPIWQCSTYFAGKNRRVSTKERSFAKTKDFAEVWVFHKSLQVWCNFPLKLLFLQIEKLATSTKAEPKKMITGIASPATNCLESQIAVFAPKGSHITQV